MSLVEYSKRETPAADARVVGWGPGDPFLPRLKFIWQGGMTR
jgi:hypothetical protein